MMKSLYETGATLIQYLLLIQLFHVVNSETTNSSDTIVFQINDTKSTTSEIFSTDNEELKTTIDSKIIQQTVDHDDDQEDSSLTISNSTISYTKKHSNAITENTSTKIVSTTNAITTTLLPVVINAANDKKSLTLATDRNASYCLSLNCQHGAECIVKKDVIYCDCSFKYTGYNCANALPFYLIIAVSSCAAIILIFGITAFICFIKSNKKKIAPNVVNSGHKEKTFVSDNLYKVDESIYSEPSDFYGGDYKKCGSIKATSTLPKIPRITMPNVILDAASSTRNSTNSTYQTFHPKRNDLNDTDKHHL